MFGEKSEATYMCYNNSKIKKLPMAKDNSMNCVTWKKITVSAIN